MTDNLRHRIEDVLRTVLLDTEYSRTAESAGGDQWVFIDGYVDPGELADAVIAALHQEWRADFGYDGYADTADRDEAACLVEDFNTALGDDWQDGEQAVVMHRYVTDWENDE